MLPDEVIEGRHEAIVSRNVFLKVNKIVEEKRLTHPRIHRVMNENLPLKKFMRCEECDTPMTGYLVKAKGLYYYKCRTKGCKHTASAKKMNANFGSILSMFQIDECDKFLVETAVMSYFDSYFQEQKENQSLTKGKVEKLKKRIQQVKERFALGKIDDELYAEFSEKYNRELCELEGRSANTSITSSNLENCLKKAMEFCVKPKLWWESQTIDRKIRIQNILFPEGICLSRQNQRVLTKRINSFFVPIAEISRALKENKKGQPIKIDELSL